MFCSGLGVFLLTLLCSTFHQSQQLNGERLQKFDVCRLQALIVANAFLSAISNKRNQRSIIPGDLQAFAGSDTECDVIADGCVQDIQTWQKCRCYRNVKGLTTSAANRLKVTVIKYAHSKCTTHWIPKEGRQQQNLNRFSFLPPPKKEVMFLVRSVCLFVCLSVGLLANL